MPAPKKKAPAKAAAPIKVEEPAPILEPIKAERRIVENPEPLKRMEIFEGDVFNESEIEMFRKILQGERDSVVEQARKAVESGGIQFDKSDLMDEVDQASAIEAHNLSLRLLDRDRKLLSEIDHAIGKLDNGEFGLCEGTGEPIPKRRLELRPWTRHSVKYKERLERMKKSGRGVADEEEM